MGIGTDSRNCVSCALTMSDAQPTYHPLQMISRQAASRVQLLGSCRAVVDSSGPPDIPPLIDSGVREALVAEVLREELDSLLAAGRQVEQGREVQREKEQQHQLHQRAEVSEGDSSQLLYISPPVTDSMLDAGGPSNLREETPEPDTHQPPSFPSFHDVVGMSAVPAIEQSSDLSPPPEPPPLGSMMPSDHTPLPTATPGGIPSASPGAAAEAAIQDWLEKELLPPQPTLPTSLPRPFAIADGTEGQAAQGIAVHPAGDEVVEANEPRGGLGDHDIGAVNSPPLLRQVGPSIPLIGPHSVPTDDLILPPMTPTIILLPSMTPPMILLLPSPSQSPPFETFLPLPAEGRVHCWDPNATPPQRPSFPALLLVVAAAVGSTISSDSFGPNFLP